MRILYFLQYFYPETSSSPYLNYDLLAGMANKGWHVDLYTSTPTRGIDDTVRKEYRKHHKREHLYRGHVHVHRMPLFREKKSTFQRMIRFMIFSLQCLWIGIFSKADAVFCGSGPPTQGVVIGMIGKLTRKKIIYNLQDIFPDSLITTGISHKNSFLWKIGRRMENFTYRHADRIIVISETMKQNILRKGAAEEKISVVYNWIDGSVHPIERENNDLFDRFGIDRGKFIVTYAGNMSASQGIITFVQAAEILKENKEIQFVIFGEGSEKSSCEAYAKDHQLDNITFLPLLGADEVSKVYSLGDVSTVLCRKGVGQAGMPSKTWNILAADTALLISFDQDSELYEIISQTHCGVAVPPENAVSLAEAIKRYYDDAALRSSCIENGRIFLRSHFSKETSVEKYLNCIENTNEGIC